MFMAAPGAFSSTLAAKLDKIDCSQVLAAALKADRAILGHIKMGPSASNIEFNWIEDDLNAVTFEGCASVSGSIAVSGFTGTASIQAIIREGALVAIRDSTESGVNTYIGKVTSVVANTNLIMTTYGSTTFTTVSTTCTWYVIGQPYEDILDASDDISRLRTKRRNFMQIFERAVSITQSRKGMDMEGITNELQYQIKQRTLEIKRELNMAVLNGIAYKSGSTVSSGDREARTMQGLVRFCLDSGIDNAVDTFDTACVTDNNGAALTVGILNALLYKMWDEGGLDESSDPIIVVGAKQQRVISAWEQELRRVEQGERTVGYYRDIFMSDMGVELPVVLDRWMQLDKVLVIDRSRVALRALSGDAWHMEKMAKTGRVEKWQISGQYGLEVRNAGQCHGLIYDCA
jgi:hypothetical protein